MAGIYGDELGLVREKVREYLERTFDNGTRRRAVVISETNLVT
jgi:hypothetical protein